MFCFDFQSIKKLADESRANDRLVVSLWKHEIKCLISDRLCRHADDNWFNEKLNNIVKEVIIREYDEPWTFNPYLED